ncbi:lactonase family protein [Sinomicrobium soli]|uniref:lactonase family protein n=1 Tax=Sinomicrobium sp. N-1-3-6 TaxID=2219864 RepID=UPI000DCF6193|nr:lactonase family protein [Sinomicrobium sp. N-1-3-6]RAV30383.1 lactonase family protein [Sinomicrobium sp. N-1-3-6]
MTRTLILYFSLALFCTACKERKKQESAPLPEHTIPTDTSSMEKPRDTSLVFTGTYTRNEGFVDGRATGIALLERKRGTGQLRYLDTPDTLTNPSYLAISPDRKNLYAVSEKAQKGETGALFAYDLENPEKPVPVGHWSTGAQAPCYVSLDSEGTYVFVANYVGGVVKMYKRLGDGKLQPSDAVQLHGSGPDKSRQEASHAHSAIVSPDDRFLFVPDLGSDKIWCFEIDRSAGKLVPVSDAFTSTAPGAGPRHMVFHPNGKYAYAINELQNTVDVYNYEAGQGKLQHIQTISSLPDDFEGESAAADIHIHPNGRFLYASNRGHNSIAVFTIRAENGQLSPVQYQSTGGDFPRNFALYPTGRQLYVANQNSDNIVQMGIDPDTGKLTPESELEVKTPVCIVFYP